jgi:hypothetical protein
MRPYFVWNYDMNDAVKYEGSSLNASKEVIEKKLLVDDFVWMIRAFCDTIACGSLSCIAPTSSTADWTWF